MTDPEKKLASALLRLASDEFSNHGCTDFDLARYMPSVSDRRAFMLRVEQWNESRPDPVDYDPLDTFEIVNDWVLMAFLADVIAGRVQS